MTVGALKRFLDPPPPTPRVGERCELCAQPILDEHAHAVDIEARRLICACRACYLLFTYEGAARGKIRAVPERYRHATGFQLDEATWDRLQIPVRTAFFFWNSKLERFVTFYPSPAGATESLLGLEAWQELVAANPVLGELQPDVEALLVHGHRGGNFDCYLVPMTACYELVGIVRQNWRGFDGGEEAWNAIDAFFAGMRARSEAP